MAITVARLHKMLGQMVKNGHGKKQVCVSTVTLEWLLTGATVLEICNVEGPKFIPTVDGDGWTLLNKDGTESGKVVVVLTGNKKE